MNLSLFKNSKMLFFRCCWLLGFLDLNNTRFKYKLYSSFLLGLHLVLYFMDTFFFAQKAPASETSTGLSFTKEILGVLLIIVVFLTVLPLVFFHSQSFHDSVASMAQFDEFFGLSIETGRLILPIYLIEVSFVTSFQGYAVSGKMETKIIEVVFGQGFQRMILGTAYYLRHIFITDLSKRFEFLNGTLHEVYLDAKREKKNRVGGLRVDKDCHLEQIKHIRRFQNTMCDMTDMLNQMFGPSIVSEVIFLIAFICYSSMKIIVQGEDFGDHFGFNQGTISCLIVAIICVSIVANVSVFITSTRTYL